MPVSPNLSSPIEVILNAAGFLDEQIDAVEDPGFR